MFFDSFSTGLKEKLEEFTAMSYAGGESKVLVRKDVETIRVGHISRIKVLDVTLSN